MNVRLQDERPEARRWHGHPGRTGANPIVILVVVLIITVVVGGLFIVLRPALYRARETARRVTCLTNLKQLGLAMNQYAQDFHGSYPWREGSANPAGAWRDLGLIYPNYMTAMKTFRCPSSDDKVLEPKATGGGMLDDKHFGTLGGGSAKEAISYSYGYARPSTNPVRSWRSSHPRDVRLLADKKAGVELSPAESAHGTDGRNVLYNDGHVKWKFGPAPLDPDEASGRIGRPDEKDFTRWWSDPPYYGE